MTEGEFTRPKDFLEAIGIDYAGLSEEERAMKKLLLEEFKKAKRSLGLEVREWRAKNPASSLGDAIRALYEIEEKAE